ATADPQIYTLSLHDALPISDQIDEALFASYLGTSGMSDPDLLIRTAGEMRISNFLLWQISYAELWITPTLWPDFRGDDLFQACRSEEHTSELQSRGHLVCRL